MKITRVVLIGEGGEEMVLEAAPFALNCTVGRCLFHGSDEGSVAYCSVCRRFTCVGHWDISAGLCCEFAPDAIASYARTDSRGFAPGCPAAPPDTLCPHTCSSGHIRPMSTLR